MIAVADVVWVIIAGAIVLGVILLGLAVIARHGRRVHISVDVGQRDDEPGP